MWYALIINGMIVSVDWFIRWPDAADFEDYDEDVISPDSIVTTGKCKIEILDERWEDD